MKDMREHLEKLQVQIAECEMIRDLATDQHKRELFARLADHFRVLAAAIEQTMETAMPVSCLGAKTREGFPTKEG